jgi:hypothetical protein
MTFMNGRRGDTIDNILKAGQVACLLALAGVAGGAIVLAVIDKPTFCAPLLCSAKSGRYIDGKCFEAAGLREVGK